MLISHRKRFIFTKTVKTAGTSVESYFERFCMPEGDWQQSHGRDEYESATGIIGHRGNKPEQATWFNHMSARSIRELVGAQVWDGYFKFTVVRNPFDKLVSGCFMFNPALGDVQDPVQRALGFRAWLDEFAGLVAANRDLIADDAKPHYLKPLVCALIDRDKYLIDGQVCVDFFLRFETLRRDLMELCRKLDVDFDLSRLPEFKKGFRDPDLPLTEYYDGASEDIVRQLYRWEIDHFGYALA